MSWGGAETYFHFDVLSAFRVRDTLTKISNKYWTIPPPQYHPIAYIPYTIPYHTTRKWYYLLALALI